MIRLLILTLMALLTLNSCRVHKFAAESVQVDSVVRQAVRTDTVTILQQSVDTVYRHDSVSTVIRTNHDTVFSETHYYHHYYHKSKDSENKSKSSKTEEKEKVKDEVSTSETKVEKSWSPPLALLVSIAFFSLAVGFFLSSSHHDRKP